MQLKIYEHSEECRIPLWPFQNRESSAKITFQSKFEGSGSNLKGGKWSRKIYQNTTSLGWALYPHCLTSSLSLSLTSSLSLTNGEKWIEMIGILSSKLKLAPENPIYRGVSQQGRVVFHGFPLPPQLITTARGVWWRYQSPGPGPWTCWNPGIVPEMAMSVLD